MFLHIIPLVRLHTGYTKCMRYSIRAKLVAPIVFATLSFLFLIPLLAHAQTQASDLSATIRAELMQDPRTAGIPSAELDAMVSILTQQAQAKGVTAGDITWRPKDPASFVAEVKQAYDMCEGMPAFFCAFNTAFGFIGPDTTIPFTLGAASMGLVWILAEMIHRRRYPGQPVHMPSD